ncbi:MAG TPA: class I SAM-dependent methyltransferase [Thermoanaerobaculia bacterium]|nr:class I SAM-dependent methyltransferase [Thermoanaerobaculia bacterium]
MNGVDELRRQFAETVSREFYIAPDQPHYASQLAFALGRFDAGVSIAKHLQTPPGARVLDVGSGNGGVSFAFATMAEARAFTLDLAPNRELNALRELVPLHSTVGDGAALPFAGGSFDVVLLLDTIEHVERPREVAAEAMRVLRPGGVCVVTTPARVRYLFRRDPHFGVPGIALLPNEAQRFIVDRILRRRPRYDVTHLYWSAAEILRLFPAAARTEVLFNRTYRPPGRFTIEWIRHPRHAAEQLRYNVRRFFFDGVMVWK